jgi:DNA-binding protein HU-beta
VLLLHRVDDNDRRRWQGFSTINDAEKQMTTTNEIADKIAAEHGLTKAQGKMIIEAVIASITEAAVAGNETSLPGFGKFKVRATPEREARNPSTGATIKVAAAKKLSFQPAKALKDALNK